MIFLPPSLWLQHPLYNAEIFLFCAQINGNPQTDKSYICSDPDIEGTHFLNGQHPISRVRISGIVTHVEYREIGLYLLVDDETSIVQVRTYTTDSHGKSIDLPVIRLGDRVSVGGMLNWGYSLNGVDTKQIREIKTFRIDVLQDQHSLNQMWLRTIQLNKEIYSKCMFDLLSSDTLAILPPYLREEYRIYKEKKNENNK